MLPASRDDLVEDIEDEMDRALEREMRRNYNRLREIAAERARRQQIRRNRYAVILPPPVPSSLGLDNYHIGKDVGVDGCDNDMDFSTLKLMLDSCILLIT